MKNFFSLVLMTLLVIFTTSACYAETVIGKVVKVSDGDTFTLLVDGNKQQRIRLYGIDAPEITGSQPYSKAARKCLADMTAGRVVSVDIRSTDRYGRYIGIVTTSVVPDVNLEMLRAGMAWHYSYFDDTPAYAKAEQEARSKRLGLWQDANPINPYEWRKRK